MIDWIDSLVITEEPSKDKNGKPSTIFYIREKPFRAGFSYQSTALTQNAAEWIIADLRRTERQLFKIAYKKIIHRSLAWIFRMMYNNPHNMMLIEGTLPKYRMKIITPSQLKRGCLLASGRALQLKTNGEHNQAGFWLKLAAFLYERIKDDRNKRK